MSSAAPPLSRPAQKQTHQPNQTLYLTNINDKIPKPDLRRALYCLFATYGPVLDVVALKTVKMRGQAHIVYRDIQTSSQAMRALQGFELFGKELRIAYGKGKSNIVSNLDGTAKMPEIKSDPTVSTELQKSIFNAPPPTKATPPPAANPPKAQNGVFEGVTSGNQGVKRAREDDSDEEVAPAEEDDEGEAMEESDSE